MLAEKGRNCRRHLVALYYTNVSALDARPAGHGSFSREAAMMQSNVSDNPSEAIRKEIFQALVEAQDQRMSVAESREVIAERFDISESQVRQIEQEGLDQQWPPL